MNFSRLFCTLCAAGAFACGGDPVGDDSGATTGLTGGLSGVDGAASGGGTGLTGATAGSGTGLTTAGTTGLTAGTTGIDLGEPVFIDDCVPGATALSDAQVSALKAGGPAGSSRLLYPYDGTAFPRGIGSPLMMWDGASGVDALYVHISSREFEYHGCSAPTAPGQWQLPDAVWEAAGQKTFGKDDPYTVEVTLLSGDTAYGPLSQEWMMAQATLKGSVYYNSYTALSAGALGGQVYRIPPGGEAEAFGPLECNGCHSVSANGERMTSQTLGTGGRTFDISSGSAQSLSAPSGTAYAALTPDGTKYVSNSLAIDVGRSTVTSATDVAFGGYSPESRLYETATGNAIPSTGVPTGALMPSFSPDGRYLVFNDNQHNGAQGIAMVTFDNAANSASDYRLLYDDSDPAMRPGWPFMLPDNGAVVFVNTTGLSFSADGAGVAGIGGALGPYSELFMVDVDTGNSTLLARAMGYRSVADAQSQTTYLPFGGEDIRRAYFPTVSPVAAGGFFWVFFDAVRHYGNMGQSRQLWCTAIEIAPDGDYTVDRSYPAFYLPGQQFGTGNHRAFTALDPCRMDNDTCSSGVDCCGGYCIFPDGKDEFGVVEGVCASETDTCAGPDERCDVNADCCPGEGGTSQVCINNFCAPIPVL